MMTDPDLIAEAARQNLDIDAEPGSEMQALIERLYYAPAPVIDLVRKINSGQ